MEKRSCCSCGSEFEPKKRNQVHCASPCRARYCRNCNYASVAGLAVSPESEEPRLGSSQQRQQQMDELFRGYEAAKPIVIDELKDGSRVVILSDMQIPFEERWLISGTVGKEGAVEKFISYYKPDVLIYNGDILDCYTISSFMKSPNRMWTLEQEANLTKRMLDYHKKIAKQARMIFIDGNHEERLWRTLVSIAQSDPRARELLGILNITSLTSKHILGLEERGIEWLPYGSYVDLLGFMVTHGSFVSQYSSYTARRMSDRYRTSGCSGHTHRLGAYYYTGAGISHAWYEQGTLCRLDPEYLHNPNWQHGFLIGEIRNNKMHTELVNAFDGSFYAAGKFFTG